jgi:VWFA-related protein
MNIASRVARVALATATAVVATLSASPQQPQFSTQIEHVRVDVLVSNRGRPVTGLRPADFEILDNGVPQRVEFASFDEIPLNVIIVLDASESVAGDRLNHLRAAVHAVVDKLKTGDQAAVITFSHMLKLPTGLTADFTRVRRALDDVSPEGQTALVDASFAGMMLAESDVGRTLQIVFSDGLDVSSWLKPDAVLDSAKRSKAVVYAVSAGKSARFLDDLSSWTGGSVFKVESTKSLSAVFLSILEEFRHRYLVSYTPQGVAANGWHTLDVRVKGHTVKARPGYLAES